jgi:hypothetical protein
MQQIHKRDLWRPAHLAALRIEGHVIRHSLWKFSSAATNSDMQIHFTNENHHFVRPLMKRG